MARGRIAARARDMTILTSPNDFHGVSSFAVLSCRASLGGSLKSAAVYFTFCFLLPR